MTTSSSPLQPSSPLSTSHIFMSKPAKSTSLPGKKQARVLIGGEGHNKMKFAIAVLRDGIPKGEGKLKTYDDVKKEWSTSKSWVPLKTGDGTVKADIASIARRTGLKKEDIKKFVGSGILEIEIDERIVSYTNSIKKIASDLKQIFGSYETYEKVKKGSKPPSEEALKNAEKKAFEIPALISQLDREINDERLKGLCQQLKQKVSQIKTSEGKANLEAIMQETTKFRNQLLPEIYGDFKVNTPEVKGYKELKLSEGKTVKFGNKTLVMGKAQSLADSKGNTAVRLRLLNEKADPHGMYALKTDGRLYYSKPEESKRYLPYSEDGVNWIRLDKSSLDKRLYCPESDLPTFRYMDVKGKEVKATIAAKLKACQAAEEKFKGEYAIIRQAFSALNLRSQTFTVSSLRSQTFHSEISLPSGQKSTIQKEFAKVGQVTPEDHPLFRQLREDLDHLIDKSFDKTMAADPSQRSWKREFAKAFDAFEKKWPSLKAPSDNS